MKDIEAYCKDIEEKWWKFEHPWQFLHYRTKERDLDHHHRQKAAKRCHWGPWRRSCRLNHSVRKIWSFEGNHDEISNQWREISHINHTIPLHSTMASQAEDKNPKILKFWPSSSISSKLTSIIRKWYIFYICIHMYMDLSIHIIHQFWNPTEIKNKLSTKLSSSPILRDSTDFISWSVGRGPEIVKP